MSSKPLSDKTLELVAGRFRLLSEPTRLRILQSLRDEEASVSELVERVGLQQANVSKHLQHLHRSGLVERRREGLQVYYRIADPSIFALCELVCGSLEEQLEGELRAVRGDDDA